MLKNVEKVEKMDIKTQQEQLTLPLKIGQIVKMSNIQKTNSWSDCFPKDCSAVHFWSASLEILSVANMLHNNLTKYCIF
jgi:hypothetical protein